MSDNENILELKFEGNGINPKVVKPAELGQLLAEFEASILSTIKHEHPEIDTGEILVCYEDIKDESIGIFFKTNTIGISKEVCTLVTASYLSLAASISKNDFYALSSETVKHLKKIQQFAKKQNCTATFKHNGSKLGEIFATTEINERKPVSLSGTTNVYGELVEAGGSAPNIHLKINDGHQIIIKTNKESAKKLAAKLYEFVGLRGFATWDIETSKILEFKLEDILDYSPGNIKGTFAELRNLSSGYWDNFNTNDEINQQLLRE